MTTSYDHYGINSGNLFQLFKNSPDTDGDGNWYESGGMEDDTLRWRFKNKHAFVYYNYKGSRDEAEALWADLALSEDPVTFIEEEPWDPRLPEKWAEEDESSQVYFMHAKNLGLVKIGFSKNVERRLTTLQTSCPDELELLKTIPGGRSVEEELHSRFEDYRQTGEWFKASPELIQYISSL